MTNTAPYSATLHATTPTVTIAADNTFMVAKCPYAGTVTAVTYIPNLASTGDNTNYRTYSLKNRGAAGSGTTTVATLQLATGVNLVAGDEKDITLSVTAADLVVAAGDVLAFASIHTASGLVDPGGLVTVTVARS